MTTPFPPRGPVLALDRRPPPARADRPVPDATQTVNLEQLVPLAHPHRPNSDVMTHDQSVAYSQLSGKGSRSHACNCIGCCPTCGGCRTAPWHARLCDLEAGHREARARIIAGVDAARRT